MRDFIAQQSRRRCDCQVAHCDFVASKFHYTGPTGPDRTRTDFFAARVSEKLRWVRAGLRQSPCGSVRVRARPVGSGRARVVEFSLKQTLLLHHFSRFTILLDKHSSTTVNTVKVIGFANIDACTKRARNNLFYFAFVLFLLVRTSEIEQNGPYKAFRSLLSHFM